MKGKFVIDREFLTDGLWTSEQFTRGQAYVDLIGLANHSPNIIIKRGIQVELDRGDVGWSIVELAKRWRWSRDRVKRFFNQLESRQQIRQHKNPAFTKIAVSNYDEIQSFDKAVNRQLKRHQTGSRRAADESLRTNDNYEKNVINEKKGNREVSFSDEFIESLKEKYAGHDVDKTVREYILWTKSDRKAKDVIDVRHDNIKEQVTS